MKPEAGSPNISRMAATLYMIAKREVELAGYCYEVDWQESVSYERITESEYLREVGWVIISSGMRESVVRRLFSSISEAFCEWRSADEVVRHQHSCKLNALRVFKHEGKIEAILTMARYLQHCGFRHLMKQLGETGPSYLLRFPFLGPATSLHLAKNLGLPHPKPDRHLIRISNLLGYDTVPSLCSDVARLTQHPIAVVDLVFWRYATLNPRYLNSLEKLASEV
jgi:hypothetical protein